MNLRDIAERIPDNVREQRLMIEADPIANAQPYSGDKNMQLLFTIWFEFVEPHTKGDLGCPHCLNRILQNYRALKNDLIELHKEYELLKSIKA